MPQIYKLSRTGLKYLYKIRHHKGHGIHSPFVYNLVRKVIEEKTPYYVYEDLKLYIQGKPYLKKRIGKYNRLSFRLVNYFGAKHILEIGSGYGVNTLHLTVASKDIECVCTESDPSKLGIAHRLLDGWERKVSFVEMEELPQIKEKQDCIFIDLSYCKSIDIDFVKHLLLSVSHENTFVVVKGIRTNKRCQVLWKGICDMDTRTAMLDLFSVGIVFFDKKLYRWNYKISY